MIKSLVGKRNIVEKTIVSTIVLTNGFIIVQKNPMTDRLYRTVKSRDTRFLK